MELKMLEGGDKRYSFDIEVRYIFLTTGIELELFSQDS